jgi:2-hydroxy fatty acid dioxygenase
MLFGEWFHANYLFYAKYHQNETNKLIHVVCVWPILFTFMYLFCINSDEIMETPILLKNMGIEFDWGAAVAFIYIGFYAVIEQPGICGLTAAIMTALSLYGCNWLINNDYNMWQQATAINIACWIAQFYGHFAHEGRSPALLDNLLQAFLFAPLFVLLELFFAVGYKQNLLKETEKNLKSINAKESKNKKNDDDSTTGSRRSPRLKKT